MPEGPGFSKVQGMGYNPSQVDALLALAKRQFDSPEEVLLRASDLRGLRLDLVSGGYAVSQVDAALDNLEDHFIRAEVTAFRQRYGDEELAKRYAELQQAPAGAVAAEFSLGKRAGR